MRNGGFFELTEATVQHSGRSRVAARVGVTLDVGGGYLPGKICKLSACFPWYPYGMYNLYWYLRDEANLEGCDRPSREVQELEVWQQGVFLRSLI